MLGLIKFVLVAEVSQKSVRFDEWEHDADERRGNAGTTVMRLCRALARHSRFVVVTTGCG